MSKRTRGIPIACLVIGLIAGGGQAAVAKPATPAKPPPAPAAGRATPASDAVAPADRAGVIGANWQKSSDRLWTTSGDSQGLHLLVADAEDGYVWRTAATLAEPGISSDRWIGNACLTASGRNAVVVYEPRHFSNREHLFNRGAFAAVVDVESGAVTKLDVNVSIAYYNPGCGAGEQAALTQSGATDLGRTRVHLVDTTSRKITSRIDVPGQLTAAVPFEGGIAAADGAKIVSVDRDGTTSTLVATAGRTASLTADGAGGLTFLQQVDDATTAVRRWDRTRRVSELGRGPLTDVTLARGTQGRVFITGKPARVAALPPGVTAVPSQPFAEVSTTGEAVLTTDAKPPAAGVRPDGSLPVGKHATFRATGRSAAFVVDPLTRISKRRAEGLAMAPQLKAARAEVARSAPAEPAGSATSPLEVDRYCAVSRNDVTAQAEQPHWAQVEWAATLAVEKNLTITRPAGWRGSGLPAWSPQTMERPIDLAGGGFVPAQIMLAVLAQESNMWQASWHALEGVPGNPLVGAYYGIRSGWSINFTQADCGYGVAQVTDGMRLAGRTKPYEVARPADEQKAIAIDYATNIAAGLRILQEKWNTTRGAGIVVNNGDPARPENWFASVWAYNSGLNPQASTGNTTGCAPSPTCTDSRGNWGLGWGNNPANPDYPYNRKPFLDGPDGGGGGGQADAAHPERWPYPEKIMGWAAYPIVKSDYRRPDFYEPGYGQAWWSTSADRTAAIKPPLNTFCGTQNNCSFPSGATGPGLCNYSDYHCWWHWPATYKPNCETSCGYRNPRYAAGAPEPARGTHYPPICPASGQSLPDLPAGALVIDESDNSIPVVRSDTCTTRAANNGTFSLVFNSNAVDYPSKIDFHQLGTGVNGHLWFAHEQSPELNASNKVGVTGTWTLNRTMNQWAKVWVHLPYTIGETQQAHYRIDRGSGAPAATRYKWRVAGQYRGSSQWVSLGAMQFMGTPSISLSNITRTKQETQGVDNVVWDAVAIQPLSAKPSDFVVAMGDSYSSGEGVVADPDTDFYPVSNHNTVPGNNAFRNGCHRAPNAWSRIATLADDSRTIGQRDDARDPKMDYQMVACAGTQSEHMLPSAGVNPITGKEFKDPTTNQPWTNGWRETAQNGSMREVTQMDSGFLDENTTLVTITVGGNDIEWTGVMEKCLFSFVLPECMNLDFTPKPSVGDQPAPERIGDYVPRVMEQKLRPTLATMLRAISAMAPNAKIVLMTYPKLLDPSDFCINIATVMQISGGETEFFNQASVEMSALANEIATTARTTGIKAWASDPVPAFEGHGYCSRNSGINGPTTDQGPGEKPSFLASSAFHPNADGAGYYRDTLNATLRSIGL
ncbi:SGNH/GDSL hydrolase family protein [Actinoplanes sp. NPDC049316]|uniref:SGNH/GDSL hydrolase family protein n=1 Tax=Actinoplanes sp. NPDC049316 TaxID=3154727 RepID=UPI0034360B62